MTDLVKIKEEVRAQLADVEVFNALVATTFKGISKEKVPAALMEGMMRGFTFKDFIEKNVYAVPFGGDYSLVTSVDYARKIGMRNGVIGKSAPVFEEDDGKIISCTVTIKKMTNGQIGEYTATVFFSEYSTGKNLWASKPHTMIAKVAEVHALRMACPEEASKVYLEEEFVEGEAVELEQEWKKEIDVIKTQDELTKYYNANKGKGKEFDQYIINHKKKL